VWVRGPESAVDLGADPVLNFPRNGPFTLAGWVRCEAGGIVLSFRNSSDGGADIMLAVEHNRASILVREDHREAGEMAVVLGSVVADGAWHHIAATRSAVGRVELFVDGTSSGSAKGDHSAGAITTDWRFIGREERRVRTGYAGANSWNGVVDELAIYGRDLTGAEIARLAGRSPE
jgi:hypothetical protein